jgi:F-type H+-transporting ATPase subunit b
MLLDAEFWVAVAFVSFLAILGYAGVYRKVLDALDRRSAQIRRDLDEAGILKQEAEAILRDAHGRGRDVERDIAQIMDDARAEARLFMAEAKSRADELVRRRTKLAEAKIAQAESLAVAEVRAAAAEAAVSAAAKVLVRSVNGEVADRVVIRGIEAVKTSFRNGS